MCAGEVHHQIGHDGDHPGGLEPGDHYEHPYEEEKCGPVYLGQKDPHGVHLGFAWRELG